MIKKYSNYWTFITNRLLRIYPMYWIIALLTYLFLIQPQLPSRLEFLRIFDFIIVGHEYSFHAKPMIYPAMVVPYAWSISMELVFYFLAPFLVKRNYRFIFAVIVLSAGSRILTYSYFGYQEPWIRFFLPSQFIFFMFGILSYRFYLKIQNKSNRLLCVAGIYYILLTVLFTKLPQFKYSENVYLWSYYILSIFMVPVIFKATKDIKIDRWIGSLSYPVYLSQYLVLNVLNYFYWIEHKERYFYSAVIILSIVLVQLLKPLEEYRRSRITN